MSRWQSRAFNKLLERVMRQRLARCRDVLEMRKLILSIDRYGTLIEIPRAMRRTGVHIGGVPCDWIDMPASRDDFVILNFHGGGFCFSSPNIHNSFLARVCQEVGARGLMVDYRLAPEHLFPAAHEDAFTVYQGLLASGYRSDQILLMGDSAGGNLVLGTLQQIQKNGLDLPRGNVLLSPACDMLMTGRSAFSKHMIDPFFDLATLLLLRNTHLGDAAPQDPLASPVFAEFSGLTPVFILVGSEEILLDDSTRMAAKLEQSGNPVELVIGDGMPHVYPLFHQLRESGEAIGLITDFIKKLDNPVTNETATEPAREKQPQDQAARNLPDTGQTESS